MQSGLPVELIDYLAIGHITQDLTKEGPVLGGSVSYAALTAKAMGLRVGIITAHTPDLLLPELEGIRIVAHHSEHNTTFENIATPAGRIQFLHNRASTLDVNLIPDIWRVTPIVHFGPVDQEMSPDLVEVFPTAFIGLTPQGWMRAWDERGKVHFNDWIEAENALKKSSAVVISINDLEDHEDQIEKLLSSVEILIITEGKAGARLYWNGNLRHFHPPEVIEMDSTGAGDIFAAAFFVRLHQTKVPWKAAIFATQLAALSVTRSGIQSVPTPAEVHTQLLEIAQ